MISNLKPYVEMKSADLPWLPSIPAHWEALRVKVVLTEFDRRTSTGEEPLLSLRMREGLVDHVAAGGKHLPPEALVGYKVVEPGTVVMNRMRAASGLFGVASSWGLVSPDYATFRPAIGVNTAYLLYLFKVPLLAKVFRAESKGLGTGEAGFLRLYTDRFGAIRIPQPSAVEQAAIVRFLDHANRRIARYIFAKKSLIALLNEQKKAIIHDAVIRGLDPDVRLKRSGLDWLGEVPEHWDVTQLRRYWHVVDCKHLTVPFVDEGIPLASVREVQSFDLDLTSANKTTEEWYQLLVRGGRRPKRGDLIYCRNVSVGAAAYVNTREVFAMGQDVCLIRSDNQNQRYLDYLLHSPFMEQQLAQLLVGSTFNRINVAEVKSLVVLVPPQPEQDSIAAYLDSVLSEVDMPVDRINREIQLIREYRTRLIADAVTGKLDVRDAAAKLPAEPAKLVALDDAAVLEGEDAEDEALEAVEVEAGA